METEIYKEFLSVADLAKALGVYRTTVYNYLKDVKNPLPSIKISRRKVLVKRVDFEKWVESYRRTNA